MLPAAATIPSCPLLRPSHTHTTLDGRHLVKHHQEEEYVSAELSTFAYLEIGETKTTKKKEPVGLGKGPSAVLEEERLERIDVSKHQ